MRRLKYIKFYENFDDESQKKSKNIQKIIDSYLECALWTDGEELEEQEKKNNKETYKMDNENWDESEIKDLIDDPDINIHNFDEDSLIKTYLDIKKFLKIVGFADVWLNNPRVPREASGTSGMTAAMNGAINFSTNDGWICEFIKDGHNGFVVPPIDYENVTVQEQDEYDLNKLYEILEQQIIPAYYEDKNKWRQIVQNGMDDVQGYFNSNRMADEYYKKLYI